MNAVLVLVDHDRGEIDTASLEALTAGRSVAADLDAELHAVIVGELGAPLAPTTAAYGATVTHLIAHELLTDYAPDGWAESVAQLVVTKEPQSVMAAGTDRGNEVMAHIAAILDEPLVANCIEVSPGEPWTMTRVRWGGSLRELTELEATVKLLTIAPHAVEAMERPATAQDAEAFVPDLASADVQAIVHERATTADGITLATAPVVVSGGRGVGSAEGFDVLEDLARALEGVVGCSRVVTNNGWRPHSDQVGQTGTVIAPELYIACGISGAIQHWVGMMAAKHVLAINTDPDAPMVTKADWAVIGDLHEVLPAVTAEIERRRSA